MLKKVFSTINAKKNFIGLKSKKASVRIYTRKKMSSTKKKKVNKKLRENEVKYCNFTNFRKFRG